MIAECPVTIVGQYDLRGKLAFIEAYGDGDIEIKLDAIKLIIELKTKDIEKNGRKYWKVTGFDYSYEILSIVDIKVENLFDGDKDRAKPILDALQYSSKELIDEVGGPIIKE